MERRAHSFACRAALIAAGVLCGCGPSQDDLARLLDENAALRKKLALPKETAITPAPMAVVTAPPSSATCVPVGPPTEPVPIGKVVETRTYAFTATAAAACGPPDEKGNVLYGVELLLEARDNMLSLGSGEVEDDKSYHYGQVLPFQDACGPRLRDTYLAKGDKVRGYIHFVVPAAAQGKTLKVTVKTGSFKHDTVRVKLDK
jgi:hypothetical protein